MDDVTNLLLGPLGLTVGLMFVLVAHFRGWWVRGKDHEELKREKDEWKEAALRGTRIAERAVSVHEVESQERRDVTDKR